MKTNNKSERIITSFSPFYLIAWVFVMKKSPSNEIIKKIGSLYHAFNVDFFPHASDEQCFNHLKSFIKSQNPKCMIKVVADP